MDDSLWENTCPKLNNKDTTTTFLDILSGFFIVYFEQVLNPWVLCKSETENVNIPLLVSFFHA